MSEFDSSFKFVSYPECSNTDDTNVSDIGEAEFNLLKGSRSFITDEIDIAAFEAYYESESFKVGHHHDESEIWEEWLKLPIKDQETFYEKGKERRILAKAVEICKSKMPNRTDEVGTYCLTCEFKKFSESKKKPYLERAKEALKSAEKKDVLQLKAKVEDLKLVDDMTASLKSRYPLINTESNVSFYVYCEKNLPMLRYKPELTGKTKFYRSIILAKRWLKLTVAEKKVYCDAVKRIKLVAGELARREISVSDNIEALSVEKRNKLLETTKGHRLQFMNDFPDCFEYYYWTKASLPKKTDNHSPVLSQTPDLKKHVPIDYDAITAPKISIVAKYRSKFHVSQADMDAVACFKREYCNHKDGLNDTTIWHRFIKLPRVEARVYYKKTNHPGRTHNRLAKPMTYYSFIGWHEKGDTKPWPHFDIFEDAIDTAVAVYIDLNWSSLRSQLRMDILPCFKATRILERRFWELNPYKRKEYFERGQRGREIKYELEHRQLNPSAIYEAKRSRSRRQETKALKFESAASSKPMKPLWANLGKKKKQFYIEMAIKARKAFLKEFPDVEQYFGFLLME